MQGYNISVLILSSHMSTLCFFYSVMMCSLLFYVLLSSHNVLVTLSSCSLLCYPFCVTLFNLQSREIASPVFSPPAIKETTRFSQLLIFSVKPTLPTLEFFVFHDVHYYVVFCMSSAYVMCVRVFQSRNFSQAKVSGFFSYFPQHITQGFRPGGDGFVCITVLWWVFITHL